MGNDPQVNKKNYREDHPFPASFPYILCKRFVITYEVRRTTEKTTENFLYVHGNNGSFVFFFFCLSNLPTYLPRRSTRHCRLFHQPSGNRTATRYAVRSFSWLKLYHMLRKSDVSAMESSTPRQAMSHAPSSPRHFPHLASRSRLGGLKRKEGRGSWVGR